MYGTAKSVLTSKLDFTSHNEYLSRRTTVMICLRSAVFLRLRDLYPVLSQHDFNKLLAHTSRSYSIPEK